MTPVEYVTALRLRAVRSQNYSLTPHTGKIVMKFVDAAVRVSVTDVLDRLDPLHQRHLHDGVNCLMSDGAPPESSHDICILDEQCSCGLFGCPTERQLRELRAAVADVS